MTIDRARAHQASGSGRTSYLAALVALAVASCGKHSSGGTTSGGGSGGAPSTGSGSVASSSSGAGAGGATASSSAGTGAAASSSSSSSSAGTSSSSTAASSSSGCSGASSSSSGGGIVCAGAAPKGPTSVCGTPQGALAWAASIPGTTVTDIAAGATDDAVVARGGQAFRLDATGALVSTSPGPGGTYFSNIAVDAHNDLDFATFILTPTSQPPNPPTFSGQLTFTKVDRCGSTIFAATDAQTMLSFQFLPYMIFQGLGADAAGNVSACIWSQPGDYHYPRAVYDCSSTGSFLGTTQINDLYNFPVGPYTSTALSPDGHIVLAQHVFGSEDFGCGTLAVPPGGAMLLGKYAMSGACVWTKALGLSANAVQSWTFAAGVDGTVALAVAYTGTIDFGGGPVPSSGTSSLGLARFDGAGNLLWAKSFGGAGSSFTVGTVHVNAGGTLLVTSAYKGTVDLGAGALPASGDTLVAAFDACGQLRWDKAVTVGSGKTLVAAAGSCGAFVATDSPTVDLGAGPLATATSIGVAGLGL